MDVTDRTFCGDVVRHIETSPGNPTSFFQKDNNTHHNTQELWNNEFTKQAEEEIRTERVRMYDSHYEPGCETQNEIDLELGKRIEFYSYDKCK